RSPTGPARGPAHWRCLRSGVQSRSSTPSYPEAVYSTPRHQPILLRSPVMMVLPSALPPIDTLRPTPAVETNHLRIAVGHDRDPDHRRHDDPKCCVHLLGTSLLLQPRNRRPHRCDPWVLDRLENVQGSVQKLDSATVLADGLVSGAE